MKDALTDIVKKIVDSPDKVTVDQEDQAGTILLHLTVDPSDMGKIIGKGGRIIKAIRDLARVRAARENLRVNVILSEQ